MRGGGSRWGLEALVGRLREDLAGGSVGAFVKQTLCV